MNKSLSEFQIQQITNNSGWILRMTFLLHEELEKENPDLESIRKDFVREILRCAINLDEILQ